ncbi:MAG TPA: SDR family oxidoreductase [Chitinophagaceae bacterium]|nr:SDR family oxidoreductase [Chitinophagaceae bacterium]
MRILVTGGAGFIGSNIVENLLADQNIEQVRVLDNLETGSIDNIGGFYTSSKFEFIQADIRDYSSCLQACDGIDLVTHQAALGSVPRSVNDPLTTNEVNIGGTLNVFTAAKEKKVKRIVYAASSSTYGDHPALPKVENEIGKPLSPYAVTKYVNELYADVFARLYNTEFIGLRYFNVFGPRQNPKGPYAAVIPLFTESFLNGQAPVINGDGNHSRDFTYVSNVVQANLLALFTENKAAVNQVYNIGYGQQTSLLQLVQYLKRISARDIEPIKAPERTGDVKHSLADISKAKNLLGYNPAVSVEEGLRRTYEWYKINNKLKV